MEPDLINELFYKQITNKMLQIEIWNLLSECNHEFVPPLSTRISTTDNDIVGENYSEKYPNSYFKEMILQNFIIVEDRKTKELIGFLSFKHKHIIKDLEVLSPANYITTICVKKEYRHLGLAKRMYNMLENGIPESIRLPNIVTRTWNSNTNHINLLYKKKFQVVKHIDNHRGEGIDTIYFHKNVFVKELNKVYL